MILYLLGLFTVPIFAGLGWLLLNFAAWFYYRVLAKHGITIEWKVNRRISNVRDATLRRDIWFERQRGPLFFTGHWYRTDVDVVNRWVGIGRRNGRSVMIFKRRSCSKTA